MRPGECRAIGNALRVEDHDVGRAALQHTSVAKSKALGRHAPNGAESSQ